MVDLPPFCLGFGFQWHFQEKGKHPFALTNTTVWPAYQQQTSRTTVLETRNPRSRCWQIPGPVSWLSELMISYYGREQWFLGSLLGALRQGLSCPNHFSKGLTLS
jgi:hypothetical protein